MSYRPRRSALYMPGANDKALEKAKTLPTDAIIFDTEDSVAPDMKSAARDKVRRRRREGEYGDRELTIRVNSPRHRVGHATTSAPPRRPVRPASWSRRSTPRPTSPRSRVSSSRPGAPDHTTIWAMLETPAAIENAVEIATSSERLAVLIMGTNDLAKELRAGLVPGRHPLLWGLARCVTPPASPARSSSTASTTT